MSSFSRAWFTAIIIQLMRKKVLIFLPGGGNTVCLKLGVTLIRSEHESSSVPWPCFSSESQLWMSLSTQLIGDYLCRNYTPFSSEFMIRQLRFITTTSQHISIEALKHVQVEWIALLPREHHHLYPRKEVAFEFRRSREALLVLFTCKTSSSCSFFVPFAIAFSK